MAEAVPTQPFRPGRRAVTRSTRPLVSIEAVTKRFSGLAVIDRLSLEIQDGEFFALLGPSGCGKTTLLRMLAGFETPDAGRILLDGQDVSGVPPHRRPVNMMFQSYALFPHLTVAGNIAFGLRQEGLSKQEIAARIAEALALLRLQGLDHRKPHQLSGGQRQRIALARCLVKRPRVLLLDEPLAALDRRLREDTRFELMELQAKLGLAFVIVTHDQDEAMTMADRIGVMHHGQLIQVGRPPEIYEQPNSRWVAQFVGEVNLIDGRVASRDGGILSIETESAGMFRVRHAAGAQTGADVTLALRPEKLRLTRERPSTADNCIAGQVLDIAYLGDTSVYRVRAAGGMIMKVATANLTTVFDRSITWGDQVWLSWAAEAGTVLTQ